MIVASNWQLLTGNRFELCYSIFIQFKINCVLINTLLFEALHVTIN